MNRYLINMNRGMILVDILLALSLAAMFTAIVTESSVGARQIFDKANERAGLLDAYESIAANSLSTSSESTVASSSRLYGNDRIETDVIASSSLSFQATSSPFSQSTYSQSIQFVKVGARDPSDIANSAGTPLCSVDFSDKNIVGSYQPTYSNANANNANNLADNINPASISITPIMLPINPLLPLTDLQVQNGIAYVSDDSSTASDPDLFIVNVKDKNNPKVLSSIRYRPRHSHFRHCGHTDIRGCRQHGGPASCHPHGFIEQPSIGKEIQIAAAIRHGHRAYWECRLLRTRIKYI